MNYKPRPPQPLSNLIPSQFGWWEWDCGWHLLNKKFLRIGNTPLGHTKFNKLSKRFVVTKKVLKQIHVLKSRMDRPWSPDWRRVRTGKLYTHEMYGNGTILHTDGTHCIFRFYDEETEFRKLVHITNLTEVKYNTYNKPTSPRLSKAEKAAQTYLKQTNQDVTPEAIQQVIEKLGLNKTKTKKEKYNHLLT